MKIYDVAIIGAGASGLMAAVTLSKNSKNSDIILIDKNKSVGKKLSITGNGRCNVTNSRDISEFFSFITRNDLFMYSSLYSFTNLDLMDFLESNGVDLKIEDDFKVFPKSDNSNDIIDVFYKNIENITKSLDTEVTNIIKEDNLFNIDTKKGKILSKKVILATGGMSYPITGSTGDGYRFAKSFNHKIIPARSSLNSILLKLDTSSIAGVSLKNIELNVFKNNKNIKSFVGDIIFTHRGISGPLSFIVSDYITDFNEKIILRLNLLPNLNIDDIDMYLLELFNKNKNKEIKTLFYKYFPKSFSDYLLEIININGNNKIHSISKNDRKNIGNIITNFDLQYNRVDDIKRAVITKGGVDVEDINPNTMESNLVENLFFCGEILDVSALTGGYNLQIAFSTGYLAGINANLKEV